MFSSFCNLSTYSPFTSITSAPYIERLVAPLLSNMFPRHYSMATFFDDRVLSSCLIFFSSFRSFVIQTRFSMLVLSPLGILVLLPLLYYYVFAFFLRIKYRMHWLLFSLSWRSYFLPISLIIFILLSAFSLSFSNIDLSSEYKR